MNSFFNTLLIILLTYHHINFAISLNAPHLPLYESQYIKIKVGINEVTLAIDPSSNLNFIFDATIFELKSYNPNDNIGLKVSNAQMDINTIFGEFKGNLALDEFTFNFEINGKITEIKYKMTFLLIKESKLNYIKGNVDGIIGFGYSSKGVDFYKQMSLIENLFKNNIINRKVVNINYNTKDISFGEDNFTIKTKTDIKMTNTHNDDKAKYYYPVLFYSNVNIGFSNGLNSYNIDNNLNANVSLIPFALEDKENVITMSFKDIPKGLKNYFNKVEPQSIKVDINKTVSLYYLVEGKNYKERALLFEDNCFPFKFVNKENKNKISLEAISIDNIFIWNINIAPAFDAEHVCFDYEEMRTFVINCNKCGKNSNLKSFLLKVVICIMCISIIIILLLKCFGFYVSYRKGKAKEFQKKYNLL